MTLLEILNERNALINRKKMETEKKIRQAKEEGNYREVRLLMLEFNRYREMMWSDVNAYR